LNTCHPNTDHPFFNLQPPNSNQTQPPVIPVILTPFSGAEYGAEASRAVWRVALDYLLFPSEAGDAVAFLDPVAAHLESWVEKSLVVQKVYTTMRDIDIGRE